MNEIEFRNSILKAVNEELTEWLSIEPKIETAYDYETKIIEMGRRITQSILKGSLGNLPKSRNKKKAQNMSRTSRSE